MLAAQPPYTSIVGPVHGVICAACQLGIEIDPTHSNIQLDAPNGATTGIMHIDKTRYTVTIIRSHYQIPA